jgi:hypothetical protein
MKIFLSGQGYFAKKTGHSLSNVRPHFRQCAGAFIAMWGLILYKVAAQALQGEL